MGKIRRALLAIILVGFAVTLLHSDSYCKPANPSTANFPINANRFTGFTDGVYARAFGYPSQATLAAAIAHIGAKQSVLIIGSDSTDTFTTWMITNDLTIPPNITLRVNRGAILSLDGKTLTIKGPFEAGLHRVFSCSGEGKVVFDKTSVDYVRPEWWYSGSGSWHTALNAAYQAFSGGYVSVKLTGTYTLTGAPWTWNGQASGKIIGAGKGITKMIQASKNQNGIHAKWDSINTNLDGYLSLQDFTIEGPGSGTGNGIYADGVSGVHCANLEITHWGAHGVYLLDECNSWHFYNVRSRNNKGDGYRIEGNATEELLFLGCRSLDNAGWGWYLNPNYAASITMIRNSLAQCETGGIYGGQLRNITLMGNYIEQSAGVYLLLAASNGGTVTGNWFYDGRNPKTSTYGIQLAGSNRITIFGNYFNGISTNSLKFGNDCHDNFVGSNHYEKGTAGNDLGKGYNLCFDQTDDASVYPGPATITGTIIKTDTGDPTFTKKGLVVINEADKNIKIYAGGAWRQIASW